MATPRNGTIKSCRSEMHSPGELQNMKSNGLLSLRDDEGKGLTGCLILIILFVVVVMLAVRLGPAYYANHNLKTDLKNEASRAGAHSLDNEMIIRDIMDMAKRNEIQLKRENITVKRFAGQIHIEVNYKVPVDFFFYRHNINFEVKASSFIGTL
jgi:hypothetical protein